MKVIVLYDTDSRQINGVLEIREGETAYQTYMRDWHTDNDEDYDTIPTEQEAAGEYQVFEVQS